MEVILAYISVCFVIGGAIRILSYPRPETPVLSPRPLRALPELLDTMGDNESSGSASSSAENAQSNPHLNLFQSMGVSLRDNPTAVIARLSAWLSDEKSPSFWAPFALSIRGFAYEVMDEFELARMDYVKGLRLYKALEEEVGKENAKRMESNMRFIRVRLQTLPPPRPTRNRDLGDDSSSVKSAATEMTYPSTQTTS